MLWLKSDGVAFHAEFAGELKKMGFQCQHGGSLSLELDAMTFAALPSEVAAKTKSALKNSHFLFAVRDSSLLTEEPDLRKLTFTRGVELPEETRLLISHRNQLIKAHDDSSLVQSIESFRALTAGFSDAAMELNSALVYGLLRRYAQRLFLPAEVPSLPAQRTAKDIASVAKIAEERFRSTLNSMPDEPNDTNVVRYIRNLCQAVARVSTTK